MTQQFASYSDWRTITSVDRCQRGGGTQRRSRDCPTGLEVECACGCGYRELLTDSTSEDFDRWMRRLRSNAVWSSQ
jgi:hypothetical protein